MILTYISMIHIDTFLVNFFLGICTILVIRFDLYGDWFCHRICHRTRIYSVVLCHRTVSTVGSPNGYIHCSSDQLVGQLFGWAWILTSTARIGTVCLHNIHRVASSLYCLCLVQGSGDEKSDHRRNHSTIQTNSILNCIDTKQNVLNVACVQDIAFTPKKKVHQFLEKIK
jgi:hypothetical protein